jgi:hypothetical protein
MRLYRFILLIQTLYYFITAAWALVDIDSFIKVTGPKTDIWLVKTVAVLLLAICAAFSTAFIQKFANSPVVMLAVTCCLVLIIVDCYYVWTKTISKVYLLDAIIEFIVLVLWVFFLVKNSKRHY